MFAQREIPSSIGKWICDNGVSIWENEKVPDSDRNRRSSDGRSYSLRLDERKNFLPTVRVLQNGLSVCLCSSRSAFVAICPRHR